MEFLLESTCHWKSKDGETDREAQIRAHIHRMQLFQVEHSPA